MIPPPDQDSEQLLQAARGGDPRAIEGLLEQHRPKLRRMVELRLNARLRGRVDPSDIVQEAMLQAAKNLEDYVNDPQVPAYLWLRALTQQQLLATHRFHLRTMKRDANLEIAVGANRVGVSSMSIASFFVDEATSPSGVVGKAEQVRILEELIDGMEPIDREILALRHFEQMGNSEAAKLLGIGETTASQRFFRALKRLRDKMREVGLTEEY